MITTTKFIEDNSRNCGVTNCNVHKLQYSQIRRPLQLQIQGSQRQ